MCVCYTSVPVCLHAVSTVQYCAILHIMFVVDIGSRRKSEQASDTH